MTRLELLRVEPNALVNDFLALAAAPDIEGHLEADNIAPLGEKLAVDLRQQRRTVSGTSAKQYAQRRISLLPSSE